MSEGGAERATQTLEGWIRNMRRAGEMVPEAAQRIAELLREEIARLPAEQRSMDGYPWAATKSGKPALQGLASHVSVDVVGTSIVVTLSGHDVYHHFGAGRVPRRAVLPLRGMPAKLGNAIALGFVTLAEEWMTRGGSHGRRGRGRRGR